MLFKKLKIGELVDLRQGFAINAKSKHFMSETPTSLHLLRIADMQSGAFEVFVKPEIPSKFIASPKDIVYTRTGKVGLVFRNQNGVVHNNCFTVTPKDEQILSRDYLFYVLKSDKFYREANARASGSAQPDLPHGAFNEIEITLPPLPEQKRIAAILFSLDNKIENNRKINKNLEEQAQALFKSWLQLASQELSIGDISESINDTTKCVAEKVVLINSSDVTEGFFDHHEESDNANLKGHFKKRFQKGDILYSQVRPRNRHWAYCDFEPTNYLGSTQLMMIRNKPDKVSSILLYYYLISDAVWEEFTLKTETRSGTFPQGNFEEMAAIKVPYLEDQETITAQLEAIRNQMYLNYQTNRRLAQLRDTLLPKLMNGEIEI